ncbi:hypothetical protein [Marinobacter mobilis]|uniref:hypothetical protein n=1 Tax=Marinobacter mobilis TaxID=488533 RepID=UPI0035C74603
MTVEDLIARLKALPPKTQVLVEGYENGFDDLVDVRAEEVVRYRHAQEWDGEYQVANRFANPGGEVLQVVVILGRRGSMR